jgi:hypothetical protein
MCVSNMGHTVTNVKDNKPERRGGRRKGAGRKPNYLKRLGLKPATAAQLLATVDEEKLVTALLHDKSADVRLRTWTTLREQVFGKPRQQIGLAGAMAVASVHQEVSDEDLDAHIKALTEQLGLAPKTLAAVPEGPGQSGLPRPASSSGTAKATCTGRGAARDCRRKLPSCGNHTPEPLR